MARDTIYALATAPGRAGIAVVRISGPRADDALAALTGKSLPQARLATLRRLYDCGSETIDDALVLRFVAPQSFTGEAVVELHLHGGFAVVDRVLDRLGQLEGLRLAERGEFSRRAVENGKLDLLQAEALADLIEAETAEQQRQAIGQYEGQLSHLVEGWRDRLVKALAWAEAGIDFAEDEVPAQVQLASEAAVQDIIQEIQSLMDDQRRGEILREGVHLTVIGPPNAGKSSLVNALARRDVAIVSATPGTTRDVIEAHLDLGGIPVVVADTAGLRDTAEAIEAEGVRRALARSGAGDLTLLVLDGSSAEPSAGLDPAVISSADLTVWNKSDLPWPEPHAGTAISLATGSGLPEFLRDLTELVKQRIGIRAGSGAVLTRARHRQAIAAAGKFLSSALETKDPELKAEDLRMAVRALGRLTGSVDVEDLLDVIFRDFCIGK